jgi:hypothetical protein
MHWDSEYVNQLSISIGVDVVSFRQHHQVWSCLDVDKVRMSLQIIGGIIDPQGSVLVYPIVVFNSQVKHVLVGELSFLLKQLREQVLFESPNKVLGQVSYLLMSQMDTYIEEWVIFVLLHP